MKIEYYDEYIKYVCMSAYSNESSIVHRRELVEKYAWAIPCPASIDWLSKFGPIVEVGAGNGYWAYEISRAGGDIIAYDKVVAAKCWHPVIEMDAAEAAALHPDRALFLCWPPYNDSMATRAAKSYIEAGGETILYIGEGKHGCTADDTFFYSFDRWDETPECMENAVPNWDGIHDEFKVWWVKKEVDAEAAEK